MTVNYNQNDCPNPSFEVNLIGYTALSGTGLSQVSYNAAYGRYSMQAVTPGVVSGEGFYGPEVVYGSSVSGTVQVELSGETGTVTVQVAVNPGGVILASQDVSLTYAWQTVTFNNLAIAGGSYLYILVTTPSPESITFLVDAVQYAPIAVTPGYIDGSSPGCSWTGAPNESGSYQLFQFPVSAAGGMYLDGQGQLDIPGGIVQLSGAGGMMTFGSPSSSLLYLPPVGALDDFAIWPLTGDVDPALSYVAWNNANTLSGQTNYSRVWGIFYPPLDYPTSDTPASGKNLWNRAAYMATGFEFVGIPAGAAQNTTQVQVSLVPLASTDTFDGNLIDSPPSPGTYDAPRSIHVIVKPTRLNYMTNPSFEVSTSGWTAGTGTTLTQDTTNSYGTGEWDGVPFTTGNASGKCVVSSGGGSISISLTNLLPGEIYTASAYVQAQMGTIMDVQMTAAGNFSTSIATGSDLGTDWYRQSVTFTATASTVPVTIATIPDPDVTYPYTFWVDDCLCEAGEVLGSYFDGSFGGVNTDYGWEYLASTTTPGPAGLSRSYYYEGLAAKQGTVLDILQNHIPVGLSYAAPLYFTVPSQ
jgi:hypothetical protein